MMTTELPDTRAGRIDWVIRAPDNAEMRLRYDIWAQAYDADVGSSDDYLAPMQTAKAAKGVFDPDARIMDAGAGTGLLGETLKQEGFLNLVAVDYAAEMLEIARGKDLYSEIHTCDLSAPTEFGTNSFDGVVSCGTTSQMPSASLREFARIVRPGGAIVFAVVPEPWQDCGYADIYSDLHQAGQLSLQSRGAPFQMMPTTEPEFMCEICVMDVH